MRSFLKIFVTFLVLAGGFAAYVLLQPASTFRAESNVRPAAQTLVRGEGGMLIGEGENAWVRQFDDEGRLASRFRAAKWEPQKNGLVRVIRPEAELFLKGGKDKDGNDKPRPRVVISGDDGEVVVQSLPDAAAADKPLQSSQGTPLSGGKNESMGPAQPPSSGRLNGVVIQVFETEDGTVPVVTMKTNNIVFDNDTFRISTESYTGPDGVTVPAEEVPVSVTGPHCDFFGRGLTVRWNDLERRLDLLRIARGDRLVIKNMDALSAPGRGSPLGVPATKPSEPPTATAARDAAPLWAMLASTDPGAAVALAAADGAARAATPPASKPARRRNKDGDKPGEKDKDEDEPTYRAAFHDGVRVVQGEQQLAVASLMNVDFLLGQREKPVGASTRPGATQAATAPASTQTGASAASTQSALDAATQPATTQPGATTKPVKVAATRPAQPPVTVYWTGELNVTPLPATAPGAAPSAAAGAETPLPKGEARVELVGSPVVLTRDLLDVKTARFVYRTDGRVALDSSPELPRVLLTQRSAEEGAPDTTVSTEGLVYALNEKLAILRGHSRVLAPIDAGGFGADEATTQPTTQPATQPATRPAPEMLDASWTELATFRLQGESEADLWVEQAEFTGNVDIKAPQGAVRSHRLELAFDAPLPPRDDPKEVPDAATMPATQPATQPADDESKPKATPQPNLRRIVATENVYCELVDAVEGRRVLQAQRLALDTARSDAGDLYPRVVDAAGEVRASTDEQELSAGHVVLHLRPARPTDPATTQPQEEQPAGPRSPRAIVADAAGAGLPAAVRRQKDERPPVELESMTATDAVRVASKDGGVATGRRLHVAVDADGQPHVELSGDPARVEDAANGSLTGPRILLDPKSGLAHVPGPGTLRAIQRDEDENATTRPATADAGPAPGAPATRPAGRPIEVTWADGADVRAADNRIDIKGMVSLWITDTDGSVRTAKAGRVTVELAQKPPEKAKEKKVDRKGPAKEHAGEEPEGEAGEVANAATQPAPAAGPNKSDKADELAGSLKMDLFKDKEVAKVHLYVDAVINSKLAAADGTLLRQFHLKARHITYDVRARHLTVPGPGQMLVESHDPAPGAEPEQANAAANGKVANGKAGAKAEGAAGDNPAAFTGGNGISAFQWAESLTYEESAGRATMGGSVVVSHQADGKNQPVVRLDADTLTAEFDVKQDGPKETASAEKPPADEAEEPRLQLRSISAAGNILIARDGAELSAHRIDFDPGTHWVVARGTPRGPATFSDPSGAGTMRADELWLNTKTWAVKVKNVNTRVGGLSR